MGTLASMWVQIGKEPRLMYRLAIAAVVMVAVLAALVGGGSAEAKCNPNRTHDGRWYTVGSYQQMWDVDMISSRVYNYDPWVYYNNINPYDYESRAYVELVDMTPPSGSFITWGQVGWIEYALDGRRTYWEYNIDAAQSFRFRGPARPENQFSVYQVTYSPNSPYLSFWVDGTRVGYSTSVASSRQPDTGRIAGATDTLANQMPGGWINPQYFMTNWILNANTWYYFDGVRYSFYPFGSGRIGVQDFMIWDYACN